jgi:hypothetical protein
MKDEEMAEEWVKQEYPTLQINAVAQRYIKSFLAGLKAGRPQWHDLRKDPNDLPDTDRIVYVQTKSDTGNAYHDNDGWHSTQVSGIVIAWCEIPTFDKE